LAHGCFAQGCFAHGCFAQATLAPLAQAVAIVSSLAFDAVTSFALAAALATHRVPVSE
jgi:hypothetical protein